jgi:hypothetical protein
LEINCLKLDGGTTTRRKHTHEAPEVTKPDGDPEEKSSSLSNVPTLFVSETVPEVTLIGLKATSEELEAAASDAWPEKGSALDIVKAFLGEQIIGTVNGPNHAFVKSMVNAAVTTTMETDIFGYSAPVQLLTMLPDVMCLGKSNPVLQLKELILLAGHYSEHTILDIETFHNDLKFAKFTGGNEVVKAANSHRDKCTGLGQKLASIIFTGIKDEIFEIMNADKTGFLTQDVLPYKRIGLLLHASGLANLRSIETILRTSALKTLSLIASDVFATEQNTAWARYNSYAASLECFLVNMDASIRVQFDNGWEQAKPIAIFEHKKLEFFTAAMKKIDVERILQANPKVDFSNTNKKKRDRSDDIGGIEKGKKEKKKDKKKKKKKKSKSDVDESKRKFETSSDNSDSKEKKKKKKKKKKDAGEAREKSDLEKQQETLATYQKKIVSYDNGVSGLTNVQMKALIEKKGDDKDFYKKLGGPAAGAYGYYSKLFLKMCNELGVCVKGNGIPEGVTFDHFIQFNWNLINFNFCERSSNKRIKSISDFAPEFGFWSYKEQLIVFEKLLSTFLGEENAAQVTQHLLKTGNDLRNQECSWDDAWSVLRCILDDFCWRIKTWDGNSLRPQIQDESKETRRARQICIQRALLNRGADWEKGWREKPRAVEDLSFNMQSKMLIGQQGIKFYEEEFRQQTTVSSLNAHLVTDSDKQMSRKTVAFGGDDVHYDNKGRPRHGTDGLYCTCATDNSSPITTDECPFWNDDDHMLPNGDRCCLFFHADAPKGFSGVNLNDRVRKHLLDLQTKGVYLPKRIHDKATIASWGERGGGGKGGGKKGGRGRGRGRT